MADKGFSENKPIPSSQTSKFPHFLYYFAGVLAVLALTIWISTIIQSNASIHDWKTFSHKTYGYSLKYPSNFKVDTTVYGSARPESQLGGLLIYKKVYEDLYELNDANAARVSVGVFDNEDYNLIDWFEKHSEPETSGLIFEGVIKKELVSVDDQQVLDYYSNPLSNYFVVGRLFTDGTRIYEVSHGFYGQKEGVFADIYRKVLNSFSY